VMDELRQLLSELPSYIVKKKIPGQIPTLPQNSEKQSFSEFFKNVSYTKLYNICNSTPAQLRKLPEFLALDKSFFKEYQLHPKGDEILKKCLLLGGRLKYRIQIDPVSEGWQYSLKMLIWKTIITESSGQKRASYEMAVHFMDKIVKSPDLKTSRFEELKLMSPEQLTELPINEFVNLSKEQRRQLPLKEVSEIVAKDLQNPTIDELIKQIQQIDLLSLVPPDLDIVMMHINNALRTELFKIRLIISDLKNNYVNANELIRMNFAQLKNAITIPADVESSIGKLVAIKKEVEKHVISRGLSPLLERFPLPNIVN